LYVIHNGFSNVVIGLQQCPPVGPALPRIDINETVTIPHERMRSPVAKAENQAETTVVSRLAVDEIETARIPGSGAILRRRTHAPGPTLDDLAE